jgi:hypothetical protein
MAWALSTLLRTKEAHGDRQRESLTFATLREALAVASLYLPHTLDNVRVDVSGPPVLLRPPLLQ